jgi:hypothetical protein
MFENTGECIVNMIKTRTGTYPLFRSFGMGHMVDGIERITRSTLQVEVAKWYPGNRVKDFTLETVNNAAEFIYHVEVEGR